MEPVSYGRTTRIEGLSFDEVLGRTTAALKEQGFGVITEIDVKATMKEKLNVDYRQYKILGACNPRFAHQALAADNFIGLLLPCNVVVFEDDDGGVVVSAVNAEEMFKVVDRADLSDLAHAVSERLNTVITGLEQVAHSK